MLNLYDLVDFMDVGVISSNECRVEHNLGLTDTVISLDALNLTLPISINFLALPLSDANLMLNIC